MSENEIISLMADSPKKARAVIVEEYRSFVYAIVFSRLKGVASPEEMEDCVNDIFMAVFDSISGYSGKGTLKAFIGTIGVRTALNRFKRELGRRNSTSSIDDENAYIPTSDDDTEETVADKVFRKRLWEIVDSLGEPDARIIVYQYCYEMKISDIARLLSMKPDAVQKRSLRARKRIRKILENEKLI